MWRLLRSISASVARAIWRDPEMQKILRRHPKTAHFLHQRLTPDQEFGLHLTVGVVVTAVFVYFFFSIVQDLVGFDSLVQADSRLVNFLQILRDPTWNSIMLFMTYVGQGQIIFFGLLLTIIILYLRRRWHYLVALLVSVLGGEAFVWLIKNAVERQRPPLIHALLPETGYSFPSSHSFVALSFYGLVFYFLWRLRRGWVWRTFVLVLGIALIFTIGFSRVYLGVHWPSDVLASYASGAAWLTVIITALEINYKFFRRGEGAPLISKTTTRLLSALFFVMWLVFVSVYFVTHPLPAASKQEPDSPLVIMNETIPNRLFTFLPRTTESVGGKQVEPVNIILVASHDELVATFAKAGWGIADQVSFHSLGHLVKAILLHRPYAKAPGTPTFWDGRANDFSFEQPTAANSVKERHHLHIWQTPYVTPEGKQVWMGTGHFDMSITLNSSIIVPVHAVDPAVDKERDKIKADLLATGAVEASSVYQMVEPTLGKNGVGEDFFTDGKAYVFFLR